MRFEVNVDDGNNLDTLHKARDSYNAANPNAQAPDMPSFVQVLMDQAAAQALQPLGPTTLSAALAKVAELEAEKAALAHEVTALSAPAVAVQATPATKV